MLIRIHRAEAGETIDLDAFLEDHNTSFEDIGLIKVALMNHGRFLAEDWWIELAAEPALDAALRVLQPDAGSMVALTGLWQARSYLLHARRRMPLYLKRRCKALARLCERRTQTVGYPRLDGLYGAVEALRSDYRRYAG